MAGVIEELILLNLKNIKDDLIEQIGYQNTDMFLIDIGEQVTQEVAECVPRGIIIEQVPRNIIEQLLSDIIEQTTREAAEQRIRELKNYLKRVYILNTFGENVAKKLIADGGFALEKISAICDLPIEKVHELAAEFALEKISAICGLPIEKVRELAAEKANQTLE